MTTPTPKISTPTPKVYFDQLTFFLSPDYINGLKESATNDHKVFEQVNDYLSQLDQIDADLDWLESKKKYLQNLREKPQLEYLKKSYVNYLHNELLSKWFMATLDSIPLHPESDYINSKEYLPIYNQISKNIDLIKILNKDSYDRGIKRKNAIASHLPAQSEPERDKATNQSGENDSIFTVIVKPAQHKTSENRLQKGKQFELYKLTKKEKSEIRRLGKKGISKEMVNKYLGAKSVSFNRRGHLNLTRCAEILGLDVKTFKRYKQMFDNAVPYYKKLQLSLKYHINRTLQNTKKKLYKKENIS